MGCYINPRDCSKEEFLHEHGELTAGPCEITATHLPVVIVHNGFFTAAAVGYSPREVEAFTQPTDNRPKLWFKVAIDDLRPVSDIHNYL